ncbi:MAG: aldo/keto reductase [Clostridia bacterium]|nr:aldo/keto reductase [Clostridia bacterium]
MKYRSFGKLGITRSAFGIGCMRFPMITNENGEKVVDEELAIRIIRTAIDKGVNYIDTAYVYSEGKNETVVGKALADGYRERTAVATKLPTWNCKTPEDLPRLFEEQCRALGTSYIDFYLVHALNGESWDKMCSLGIKEFLDSLKASGRIKYACFSFHDGYDAFERILNDYDWDMCQIQYNYMDINNQAGTKGLELAGKKGIPVVIMEGLLGGKLANAPDNVQELFDAFPIKRSPVEWAFRWLCNHTEVGTVLSGVTSMEQLEDNLRIFDTVESGLMSSEELELIDKVREAYESRTKVGCTGCKYCMPCPNGVEIPRIFSIWNDICKFNGTYKDNARYKRLVSSGNDATKCIECAACESVCPQNISIIQMLKNAHNDFTG